MQRIVDGFIDLEVGFVEDLLFRLLPPMSFDFRKKTVIFREHPVS